MPTHYKAFLVVLSLTLVAFWLARPAFTKFMADQDYVRRRNLWIGLTTAAFLLPSFWLYMGVAAILVWRAGKHDPNPAALYLFLLLVVPPFSQPVPGFGLVNFLFPLDHFRLLGLALILPTAIRMRRAADSASSQAAPKAWLFSDVLLIIYGTAQIVLYAPYTPATGSVRGLFMLALDVLLPFYVLSRSCTTKQKIVEAIAAFALSAVVLAPMALFEAVKGWLLYSSIADYWRIDDNVIGYLLRSDILRAQVTSGQSIVFGAFYAAMLGLWLYLQTDLKLWHRLLGTAAVLGGLAASFSRGPWVGAAVIAFVFFAVGPNAVARVSKLIGFSAVLVAALLLSPMGATVVDHLPFVGTVETGNIGYRQAMNDKSWLIIQQNPWFGTPYFANYLEEFRQGQGIIDLLNAYLSIGMAYGLVTLGAFVLFLASVAYPCFRVVRKNATQDPDTSKLGAAMLASFLGMLVIIYTVNNYLSVPYVYLGLAALMVAYSRLPVEAVESVSAERAGFNNHVAPRSLRYRT